MGGDLTLRVAAADDWATYRDVRLAALKADPAVFGSRYEDELRRPETYWRQRVVLEDGATFLAFDGDRCVGTATGAPWFDDHGADPLPGVLGLFGMWVRPDARGRGVGAALVEAVVGFARDHGWSTIQLLVSEGAPVPRRLYERCGFVDTGERVPIRDEPGAWVGVIMRRTP
jgi:GNAT superfamily N-acetyltransferase